MRGFKQLLQNKAVFGLLLAASLGVMGLSGVQTSRAARTQSESYTAQLQQSSDIAVALVENGQTVTGAAGENGTLLENMLGENEQVRLGRAYDEVLTVQNTGSIDEYVRVILCRYWLDDQGNKNTTLRPDLIDLHLTEGSGWYLDKNASTAERIVLYYTRPLGAGESSSALADTLRIDDSLAKERRSELVTENGETKTVTTFKYDGYRFMLEAEVDGVQTHNAQDAIKSAWGIEMAVDGDGNLSFGG